MNKEMDMREVLEKVKQGEISVEDAEHYFRKAPFDEMGYAKLDMHRQIRSGFPEVIFCSGVLLFSDFLKTVLRQGRHRGRFVRAD